MTYFHQGCRASILVIDLRNGFFKGARKRNYEGKSDRSRGSPARCQGRAPADAELLWSSDHTDWGYWAVGFENGVQG